MQARQSQMWREGFRTEKSGDKSGKRKKKQRAEGGGGAGGKRGNSYRNICSGIPRGIGFQPNPNSPATCQTVGTFRVPPSTHFRVFLFLPFFIFAIPDCSVCRPMVFHLGTKHHATEDQLLSRGGSLPLSSPRPPGKHRLNVQPRSPSLSTRAVGTCGHPPPYDMRARARDRK